MMPLVTLGDVQVSCKLVVSAGMALSSVGALGTAVLERLYNYRDNDNWGIIVVICYSRIRCSIITQT